MGKFINELGNKYGRLTVIERSENYDNRVSWLCKCDCGNKKVILGQSLRVGLTKSCGCLQKELMSKRMKGFKHPKETVKKMLISRSWYKHSEEVIKKMSKAAKNRPPISKETREKFRMKRGDKNNRWNPNLTDEERLIKRNYLEYHEWRTSIYERDDYTCQVCGKIGGALNAHHLESYSINKELRTVLSNGVTLCNRCHKDFHYQYGNSCTKEQFEEFTSWFKK